ncbi:MAG: HlyC/CorC family transporter [Alphaproteobacteria bacterium]|nr:HlyC/CorC family transporter [Alphaproteobacteria bacterium]
MNDAGPSPSASARARSWLRRVFRRGADDGGTVRGAIAGLIKQRNEAQIAPDERMLITNVLELHGVTAADVMVPRADVVAVAIDTPMSELVTVIGKEAHSRLPVFRESLDDVAGMVHIKDVVVAQGRQPPSKLADLVREILFVAPSIRVLDLLLEMRQKRIHMAMVVDEYGGVDGLVTIEDLVEEIVGEIEDEHDSAAELVLVERADGTFIADGRTSIEELETRMGKLLSEEEREEVDTVAGLVIYLIDRVPRRGEIVRHPSGLEFEVLEVDPRRIRRLRLRRGASQAPAGDATPNATALTKA